VGLEHLRFSQDRAGYFASSVVIGTKYGQPFSAWYGIRCDANWQVRQVDITTLHGGDKRLELLTEGDGHWQTRSGQPLPALDGCIDVDISATPYTNTLPIRRLALSVGQSAELLVAYITVPEMQVQPARQRYTCLEASEHGGLYKYEGLSTGFTANISVDADGLVINYPEVFKRV
jgi:hypothetical protein